MLRIRIANTYVHMTQFISHVHAEFRRARLTRRGSTQQAEHVPTGVHKTYDRMEIVQLPAAEKLDISLQSVLQSRTSYFGGSADGALTVGQWGTLLGLALGKKSESKRRNYPSGGALYPIETYIITRLGGDSFAALHYNPTKHALEKSGYFHENA